MVSIKKEVDERRDDDRASLIHRLEDKENRRLQALRLGVHQEEVKESILELYTLNAFLHGVAENYMKRYRL